MVFTGLNDDVEPKSTFFLFWLCYFLLLLQKKVTKEKEPGKDNFSLFWQNTLGFTLPKKSEVRAFSGLPLRRTAWYY